QQLTVDDLPNFSPAWSPDGTQLAFMTIEADNTREIYVMDVRDGRVTNLTQHPADDSLPAWSPDGTRLAFVSTRDDGQADVFVINLADGAVRNITQHPAAETSPVWWPVVR
ncbi:MAG: hypothetical protein D6737_08710, partial [Chloroflexi bacterium]